MASINYNHLVLLEIIHPTNQPETANQAKARTLGGALIFQIRPKRKETGVSLVLKRKRICLPYACYILCELNTLLARYFLHEQLSVETWLYMLLNTCVDTSRLTFIYNWLRQVAYVSCLFPYMVGALGLHFVP